MRYKQLYMEIIMKKRFISKVLFSIISFICVTIYGAILSFASSQTIGFELNPAEMELNESFSIKLISAYVEGNNSICSGTIDNLSDRYFANIEVQGSFTNSSGAEIKYGTSFVNEGAALNPGESAPFTVLVPRDINIVSCTVSVLHARDITEDIKSITEKWKNGDYSQAMTDADWDVMYSVTDQVICEIKEYAERLSPFTGLWKQRPVGDNDIMAKYLLIGFDGIKLYIPNLKGGVEPTGDYYAEVTDFDPRLLRTANYAERAIFSSPIDKYGFLMVSADKEDALVYTDLEKRSGTVYIDSAFYKISDSMTEPDITVTEYINPFEEEQKRLANEQEAAQKDKDTETSLEYIKVLLGPGPKNDYENAVKRYKECTDIELKNEIAEQFYQEGKKEIVGSYSLQTVMGLLLLRTIIDYKDTTEVLKEFDKTLYEKGIYNDLTFPENYPNVQQLLMEEDMLSGFSDDKSIVGELEYNGALFKCSQINEYNDLGYYTFYYISGSVPSIHFVLLSVDDDQNMYFCEESSIEDRVGQYDSQATMMITSDLQSVQIPETSVRWDVFFGERDLENEEEILTKEIIMKVQEALNSLGYDCGGVDGSIGPKTESAIILYQQDRGLSPSGDIDTQLIESLGIDAS